MYRVNFSVELIDGNNKAVVNGVIRSDHEMTEEEIKKMNFGKGKITSVHLIHTKEKEEDGDK